MPRKKTVLSETTLSAPFRFPTKNGPSKWTYCELLIDGKASDAFVYTMPNGKKGIKVGYAAMTSGVLMAATQLDRNEALALITGELGTTSAGRAAGILDALSIPAIQTALGIGPKAAPVVKVPAEASRKTGSGRLPV